MAEEGEAAAAGSGDSEEESENEGGNRFLAESTLYKEDVLVNGHSSVWGSWYDPKTKSWGYGCCRSKEKGSTCTCKDGAEGAEGSDAAEKSQEDNDSILSGSSDSEQARRKAVQQEKVDWSAPVELLSREAVEAAEGGDRPGTFVLHFVRFVVGAWQRLLEEGGGGGARGSDAGANLEQFRSQELKQVMANMEPLLLQLEGGRLSQAIRTKDKQRGSAGIQRHEGDQANPKVVRQLDKMVSLTVEKKYVDANKAYMEMVLGHKKWNNTLASYGGTGGTNKGARIYITKQDDLLEYDRDPVVQRYIQAIRKLVLFAQAIRPNPDPGQTLRV